MESKDLQLVTNEQAMKLKELGFDWPVHYYMYLDYYELHFDSYADNWNNRYNMSDSDYRVDGDEDYPYTSVPSVALALKWFREKYNAKYNLKMPYESQYYYGELIIWGVLGTDKPFAHKKELKERYTTYDELESAILDELIETYK